MFAALLSALATNDFTTSALLVFSNVWSWGG